MGVDITTHTHPSTPTHPTMLERHAPLVVATVHKVGPQRPYLMYRTPKKFPGNICYNESVGVRGIKLQPDESARLRADQLACSI